MIKNILFLFIALNFVACSKKASTPDINLNQIATGTTIATGNFSGTPGHNVSGTALWLHTSNALKLQLHNLMSTAGPDLRVYIAKDMNAGSFISLGKLQSTTGNQVYDIPAGSDATQYKYVLIWCQQFSVLFGSAILK